MAGADHEARFESLAALEQHLRRIHEPFGALTDAQWRAMAEKSARVLPDGGVALHYDPKIADPIKATEPTEMDLWYLWKQIQVPVLAIRGERSDLLSADTLAKMEAEGARSYLVAGAGHAPSLEDSASIAVIRSFLEGG